MENITIQLPINIGDNLYSIKDGKIQTYTIQNIKIEIDYSVYINNDKRPYIMKFLLDRPINIHGDRYMYLKDIGDTMFLSKTDILKNIADQL